MTMAALLGIADQVATAGPATPGGRGRQAHGPRRRRRRGRGPGAGAHPHVGAESGPLWAAVACIAQAVTHMVTVPPAQVVAEVRSELDDLNRELCEVQSQMLSAPRCHRTL